MANKHYYQFDILDYSEETSGSKIHFGAVTAINIAGVLAQLGNLRNAITGLVKGTLKKDMWVGDSTQRSNTPPTDPTAQVELKLRFDYEGATNKKRYRIELPTADPAVCLPNSDQVDMAHPDVAAFVTAFETIGRTPDDDTEGVEVLGARLVGRNI